MNTHQLETMVTADRTAQRWLHRVADGLRTPDLSYAYRLLGAWLHTLRDWLPITQAVRLADPLPEPLRRLYYDGWEPAKISAELDPDSFIGHFAREARISVFEVWHGAPVVSAALHSLFSPGHLEQAFATLPPQIRTLVEPIGGLRPASSSGRGDDSDNGGSVAQTLPVPSPRHVEDRVRLWTSSR